MRSTLLLLALGLASPALAQTAITTSHSGGECKPLSTSITTIAYDWSGTVFNGDANNTVGLTCPFMGNVMVPGGSTIEASVVVRRHVGSQPMECRLILSALGMHVANGISTPSQQTSAGPAVVVPETTSPIWQVADKIQLELVVPEWNGPGAPVEAYTAAVYCSMPPRIVFGTAMIHSYTTTYVVETPGLITGPRTRIMRR